MYSDKQKEILFTKTEDLGLNDATMQIVFEQWRYRFFLQLLPHDFGIYKDRGTLSAEVADELRNVVVANGFVPGELSHLYDQLCGGISHRLKTSHLKEGLEYHLVSAGLLEGDRKTIPFISTKAFRELLPEAVRHGLRSDFLESVTGDPKVADRFKSLAQEVVAEKLGLRIGN